MKTYLAWTLSRDGLALPVQMASNLVVAPAVVLRVVQVAWSHTTKRLWQGRGKRPPRGIHMKVLNGTKFIRKRFWRGCAWKDEARCMVRIGELDQYPDEHTHPDYNDFPVMVYNDWRENLCGLAAHELWHLMYRGPSGRAEEYECELVEAETLEFYRKVRL